MGKRCDLCGDFGFEDLIATCSRCSIAREHVYCMQNYLKVVPEVWFCEPCRLSIDSVSLKYGEKDHFPMALTSNSEIVHRDATHSVGPTKLPNGSSRQDYNRRQNIVETAKVKFISTEEAIMLSSGTQKGESPVQINLVKSPLPSNTVASMSKRIPNGSKTVTPKFSQSKVKANPSFGSPGLLKPHRHFSVKQAPQASKEFKGKTATLVAPAKENLSREQPIEVLKPANERETSNTIVEKAMNKASCASSPSMHCLDFVSSGGDFCADAELRNSNVEEKNLLNILSTLVNYIPNPPMMDATWKGSFEILGSTTPGKPYDGFQAHPPSKVHQKAYEFSKRMPAVLQFKLLPRCNLWADIFQDDCPSEDDIALYIVPRDFERSQQSYVCLVEVLDMHDSVMRSYMDGVELLIFTSKQLQLQLQVDSQRLNMKYFLWGVFRCVKDNEAVTKEHKGPPLLVSPLEGAHVDHANGDNGELSDMEIDMIGGENVGRIDVAVLKESIRRVCGKIQQPLLEVKREECDDHDLSPGVVQKVKSEFAFEQRPFQSSLVKFSNAVDKLDPPPGFKGIFKCER